MDICQISVIHSMLHGYLKTNRQVGAILGYLPDICDILNVALLSEDKLTGRSHTIDICHIYVIHSMLHCYLKTNRQVGAIP